MKKADHATDRLTLKSFEQIVNIGPSLTADFQGLGLETPTDLIGSDPVQLYQDLCHSSGVFHDPCVLDCFLAAVHYMDGNKPRKWWDFTSERKEKYAQVVQQLRRQFPVPPASSN